jgi:para-nitrobenzyl esterase
MPLHRNILAALSALALFGPARAAPATLRVTGGQIAAARETDGISVYRGLPFAAPPVGALRWRAPAAVVGWHGVRPVDMFGSDCLQSISAASPATRPKSEDCLYLNVWTSAPSKARKPVFVWFHGGASIVGSGAQPQFDGTALARQGVIVVTANYRLGPLGFLSTAGLSRESGYGGSGNYGFMDQIAALRWVKANIAAFGGDADAVTIGGESAGSVSTSTLMASPLAKGLFARVIGESGSAFRVAEQGSMGATTLAAEASRAKRLLDALTLPDDPEQLRAVPAADVLAAANRTGLYYNLPTVDGKVLPRSPWNLFAAHQHNNVPLLVGWNSDEGTMQAMATLAPVPQLLARYYGAGGGELARYYTSTSPDDEKAIFRIAGDNGIAFSTWRWAMAQARYGSGPVYLYEFDRAPPLPAGWPGARNGVERAGAFHGSEIVYVFNSLSSEPSWAFTEDDRRIARQMSAYWANFIKRGDPNGPGLPAWPHYEPNKDPHRMRIGLVTAAEPDGDYQRFMAIWKVRQRIDPPEPAFPTAP